MFNVKLEKFEGPLGLLLKLIENQKLDITRVSLARVADDYLEYVRSSQNISLENLADFINIASKIVLIKSQSILPNLEITAEEEKEVEDLENQLKEYGKFKQAARSLRKLFKQGSVSFSRNYLLGVSAAFSPPSGVNVYDLKKHFTKILDEIVLPEKLSEESVKEIVTLENKIDEFQRSLKNRIEISFSQISDLKADKTEIIISFLAMLELVKQKIISVEQSDLFEEIKIVKI